MIVKRTGKAPVALPLLNRLIPSVSNTGKLIAANTLIQRISFVSRLKGQSVGGQLVHAAHLY